MGTGDGTVICTGVTAHPGRCGQRFALVFFAAGAKLLANHLWIALPS